MEQWTRMQLRGDFGLTFDDVLLVPRHATVHPRDVDVRSRFTRAIPLNVPIISAAMDTVTEAEMGIAMARFGGIGVIHKNMPIDRQATEVDRVKRSESGMILNPITLGPDRSIREAAALMSRFKISGVPIVDDAGRLVGIITNRDLQFERNLDRPLREAMTRDQLVTAPIGTTLEQAEQILGEHRIEKLPVVDERGILKGLITVKDIIKRQQFPNANKDEHGRLRVAAALGVGRDTRARAAALLAAGADALVLDSAHGHSAGVLDTVATPAAIGLRPLITPLLPGRYRARGTPPRRPGRRIRRSAPPAPRSRDRRSRRKGVLRSRETSSRLRTGRTR